MNPICFRSILLFRLYDDDDESDIKPIRTRIPYRINTVSCGHMNPISYLIDEVILVVESYC